MTLGYGDFNPDKMEYKYRINHNLSFNGNIQPTKTGVLISMPIMILMRRRYPICHVT